MLISSNSTQNTQKLPAGKKKAIATNKLKKSQTQKPKKDNVQLSGEGPDASGRVTPLLQGFQSNFAGKGA